ncbi:ATP-binding protein [Shewanella sp. OMA3-2]|uniref:ATP-binding protein n=1 Tax=Shewanella sp. OMA3-2 TaxID=2908650 RepID=UPI001F20878C|nr:ATP-binding protein [Shewanella sp. OMA3-2]UJF21075.1 ATP-binding protein [Shewanella sp. OMA3-2]
MQLIMKPQKRLLTRMFITSLSIIALVGFGFAWLVTLLNAQNRYTQITADYIAELPIIAAEFRENNLVPITEAQDNDNIETSYIMATCDEQYTSLWRSELAKDLSLTNICEKYNLIKNDSQAYFLEFEGLHTYLVFKLSTLIEGKPFHLLILQDAEAIKKELKKFNRLTYFRLAIVLGAAFFLLVSAAYWGMLPLKQLKQELLKLKQGKQQNLSNDYPVELQEITQSLNQLLDQNQQRQTRYQNAMNDLAHSLKTRLAASIALIDDTSLNAKDKESQILTQIEDMDHLVKYQLKRAMMGRQGLLKEHTEIKPILEQLVLMLSKLYQRKNINFIIHCPDELAFPVSKGDLMELCGNLIENAAKFCISTIEVTVQQYNGLLRLQVDDDGPGVEEAYKQKIFQRGVRADTQHNGQGIGLAVCFELVSSYAGTFQIQTSHLEGASFIIELPNTSQ